MIDIPDWLYEYLLKFKKAELIEIMGEALDRMQKWNGRTMAFCIVSSIDGAECIETDTGGYIYRLPKKGAK